MTEPKVVYLDSCAWQTLSDCAHKDERKRLLELCQVGHLRFACSMVNIEERVHGIDYSKSDSKRVRAAAAMLRFVSSHHFFRDRAELIESGEIEGAYYLSRDMVVRDTLGLLKDLARRIPRHQRFLRCFQALRNCERDRDAAYLQSGLAEIKQKRQDDGQTVQEVLPSLSDGQVLKMVAQLCEGYQGVSAVFYKAHTLLSFRKAREGKSLDRGDMYDMDHVVFGHLADVFVTEDIVLSQLAGTLRDDLGETKLVPVALVGLLQTL
jgi:hypothetical protein